MIWVNTILSWIKQKRSVEFLQSSKSFLMKSHKLFFELFKSHEEMHILCFSFCGMESFINLFALSLRFSSLTMGCKNATKKLGKLIHERRSKVSKIYSYNSFPFWWYKDWKMSIYKPGQVRACFFGITEKSHIISFKILFCADSFCLGFLHRRKFCHI